MKTHYSLFSVDVRGAGTHDEALRTPARETTCKVIKTVFACEQALRGALAAGREKEGELAVNDVTNFWSLL